MMLRLTYKGWSRAITKGYLDLSPIRAWLKETNRIIEANMPVDNSAQTCYSAIAHRVQSQEERTTKNDRSNRYGL